MGNSTFGRKPIHRKTHADERWPEARGSARIEPDIFLLIREYPRHPRGAAPRSVPAFVKFSHPDKLCTDSYADWTAGVRVHRNFCATNTRLSHCENLRNLRRNAF